MNSVGFKAFLCGQDRITYYLATNENENFINANTETPGQIQNNKLRRTLFAIPIQ